MKRQGNLLSFAFFGFIAEAALLLLLAEPIAAKHAVGFLFAAAGFLLYRAFIEERRQGLAQESYLKREMRRWWLRQEPENTFSFALIGGMLLVACNFALWQAVRLIDVWVMGFVAVCLTQIVFEEARQFANRSYAYIVEKKKKRKLVEVKKSYGLREVAYESGN